MTPWATSDSAWHPKSPRLILRRGPQMIRSTLVLLGVVLVSLGPAAVAAPAQALAKGQVANLISKVENGVDDFEKYLEKRGENASDAAKSSTRRKGQGANESQKSRANAKKDALDEALDNLNKSTNRLRRRFDATDKWIETKVDVERVLDDARHINQVVARGSYGAEAARLWGVLRTGINDLARAYNVPPLGV